MAQEGRDLPHMQGCFQRQAGGGAVPEEVHAEPPPEPLLRHPLDPHGKAVAGHGRALTRDPELRALPALQQPWPDQGQVAVEPGGERDRQGQGHVGAVLEVAGLELQPVAVRVPDQMAAELEAHEAAPP